MCVKKIRRKNCCAPAKIIREREKKRNVNRAREDNSEVWFCVNRGRECSLISVCVFLGLFVFFSKEEI